MKGRKSFSYCISAIFWPVFARKMPTHQRTFRCFKLIVAMAALDRTNYYEYLCMHCKPAEDSSADYTPFILSESACTIVVSFRISLCLPWFFLTLSSLFSTSRAHLSVFVLTRNLFINLIKQSTFAIFLPLPVNFSCFLHSIAFLTPCL